MSSGTPMRPYGIMVSSDFSASAVSQAERLIGVWIAPGEIEFTRMRCEASSWATDCMNIRMPPFEDA